MATGRDHTTVLDDAMADTEAVAEMLGDRMPLDWQEPLAIAGRRECLAGAACAAADAALYLITIHIDLRGRADTPETRRMVDALFDLERAWRAYCHDTQRGLDVYYTSSSNSAPSPSS